MKWITAVDDLKSSQSTRGRRFPNFEMLNAKIPSSLKKIIPNSHFKKRVNLAEQKAQLDDRFLRGRQIAFMNVLVTALMRLFLLFLIYFAFFAWLR